MFVRHINLETLFSVPYETNACSHLADQDLEGALKALEGQDQLDPREVAIIKYTPSAENPHSDYADEVYYPPIDSEVERIRNIIMPQNAVDCKRVTDIFNYLTYLFYRFSIRHGRSVR